jgi:hypothetical protein
LANYIIEQREAFDKPYLKVKLKDNSKLSIIQSLLNNLKSIKNVNITNNTRKDLTVYPTAFYEPSEVEQEIIIQLDSYFNSSPIDPIIVKDKISTISDRAYGQIIHEINIFGKNLEKYNKLNSNFDEEGFRDFFLPHLNSISANHCATAETFNKIGRSDILIQDSNGLNVFIAECKIWYGESHFLDSIDQLLSRYVTWRDEHTALIIFNKNNKNFTDIIDKCKSTIKNHKCYYQKSHERYNTSISYLFRNFEDNNKIIKLELILFNCS